MDLIEKKALRDIDKNEDSLRKYYFYRHSLKYAGTLIIKKGSRSDVCDFQTLIVAEKSFHYVIPHYLAQFLDCFASLALN